MISKSRYSSKKQEVHFQPRRIRVLQRLRTSWQYSTGDGYTVVIQNVFTHEIVATWTWVRVNDGFWDDEGNGRETKRMYPHVTTKSAAVSLAKREATKRNLPFDLRSDVLDENEAIEGPRPKCMVCGKRVETRSFERLICDQCLADVEIGAATRSEKEEWLLHRDDLLPYVSLRGDFRSLEAKFGELLIRIAGSTITSSTGSYGRDRDPRRIRLHDRESRYPVGVPLYNDQGRAMQELLDFLKDLVAFYEARGVDYGSNLLKRLADGEINPVEFQIRRDEIKARAAGIDLKRRKKS